MSLSERILLQALSGAERLHRIAESLVHGLEGRGVNGTKRE